MVNTHTVDLTHRITKRRARCDHDGSWIYSRPSARAGDMRCGHIYCVCVHYSHLFMYYYRCIHTPFVLQGSGSQMDGKSFSTAHEYCEHQPSCTSSPFKSSTSVLSSSVASGDPISFSTTVLSSMFIGKGSSQSMSCI